MTFRVTSLGNLVHGFPELVTFSISISPTAKMGMMRPSKVAVKIRRDHVCQSRNIQKLRSEAGSVSRLDRAVCANTSQVFLASLCFVKSAIKTMELLEK